jgi:putative inorganic carbon (hco3(-)) transporter
MTHTMINKEDISIDYLEKRESNLLYYGLLFYIFLFYSQIAGRFPVLAPFRIEFVIGSILVFVALARIINSNPPFNENRLNQAAMLFLVLAFISIPFALVKTRALNEFIHLIKFFAIYLMIIVTINNEKRLKGFVYIYLGMITLLFIEPFFLSLQGKGFIYNNHMLRLAGVTNYFGHPNQLGGMTAENLPFFYYLMKYDKSKAHKVIYLILILISLRVIMLTQSRTGFLGIIVFGFFILIFSKKKILSLFAIALSCIMLWQVAPQETKDRFFTLSRVGEVITTEPIDFYDENIKSLGSMASRWELIRRGFVAFTENPILGLGLDCFTSFNGRRWGYWFPPHNTYIQALAEMGIIGFSAFIYVIFMTFKNLHHSNKLLRGEEKQQSFMNYMTYAVTAYLLVRIVVAFFGQDLYENNWWVAGGLSVVLLRICKSKYQNQIAIHNQT